MLILENYKVRIIRISNFNVFLQVLLTQNSTTCNVNVIHNYAINLKAIQLFAELLLINDSRYCTHFKCKGVKLTVSFFALRKCFCVSSWLFDFLSTSLLHLVVFGDVYIISCSSKHVELFAFLGAYVIGFKILIYCKEYLKRTILSIFISRTIIYEREIDYYIVILEMKILATHLWIKCHLQLYISFVYTLILQFVYICQIIIQWKEDTMSEEDRKNIN